MIPFPNEEKESASTQTHLQREFNFASRLYSFWLEQEKDRYLLKSELDSCVVDTAVMLNVQACRLFRTLVESCNRCEGYSAGILSRSLYETALATGFVLNPKLRVRLYKTKSGRFHASLPPKGSRRKSDELSQDFRAKLYLSYMALEREIFAHKCSKKRGRKQYSRSAAVNKKLTALVDQEIGLQWKEVLIERNSFSGLTVAELATAVGNRLDHWYDTVYYFQSKMTHSSSALRHMSERGSVQWLSPIHETNGMLHTGTCMFLICLFILTKEIDFGIATSSAMLGFKKEYATLFS